MKKLFKVVLPAVAILFAGSVFAQAAPVAKIGVLDMQQIMQKSSQVLAINKQLQAQFQPRQQKIEAAQKQLQDEVNNLNRNASVMSAADRTKLQEKATKDKDDFQAMVQSYQKDLNAAQSADMQKFMGSLNNAVATVAKDGGYTLIVQRAAVPYMQPDMDVTPAVLKALG